MDVDGNGRRRRCRTAVMGLALNSTDLLFGRKPNIFDNMNYLLEKYTNNLEALVDERTEQLLEEKKKTGRHLHLFIQCPSTDSLF